jgi:hypothetical protein
VKNCTVRNFIICILHQVLEWSVRGWWYGWDM